MIAEGAVALGRRLAGRPTAGADSYWAARVWDREAQAEELMLGPHYRAETVEMCTLIERTLCGPAAPPVRRAIDVGCGVGVFTAALLDAGIAEVVALDVSPGALARTRERVGDDARLRTVQADIRHVDPAQLDHADASRPFDALVCVDALHHIGEPVVALEAMSRKLVRPGGVLIGNIWTADHFHEFQRLRRGRLRHASASVVFCASAIASRFGRPTNAMRTELVIAEEALDQLAERFELVDVAQSRYWLRFVVRTHQET